MVVYFVSCTVTILINMSVSITFIQTSQRGFLHLNDPTDLVNWYDLALMMYY